MPELRAMMQRSGGKEQKPQHINETESILLKGCTSTGVRNYPRSRLEGLTAALHGILYVLEISLHICFSLGGYTDIRETRSST
ncbi:hypothetical protein TNCV_591841 [Trichonephila clavipes]|nr:hypothetical protein TNCV_591841 [Trichonephila clavipes]